MLTMSSTQDRVLDTTESISSAQWESHLSLPHISDTFFVTAARQEGKNQASILKLKVLFQGLFDEIKTKLG